MASLRGQIDSSFTTDQRDLFASGIVAEIGVTAYAVWHGIKYYADFNTGEAFPGMRTLGQKLGVSKDTVQRAVDSLVRARLLRVVKPHSKRRGQTYIARERMTVRVGSLVLCTIVMDYVPERLRGQIKRVTDAIEAGKTDPDVFAEVEIIPGDGFVWDEVSKSLRARVDPAQLPAATHDEDAHFREIGQKILAKSLPSRKASASK